MQKPTLNRMFSEADQEVELYTNSRERQQYDEQANLYAIITATEHLERAYAKDDITREEVSIALEMLCQEGYRTSELSGLALQPLPPSLVHDRMQQAYFTISPRREGRPARLDD